MTLILAHIPKCGGTTLQRQLSASPLSILFDYEHQPHYRRFYRDACARRNLEFQGVDFSARDMIFGHFPYARYREPPYEYMALLRDPIERLLSQYFYWKNELPRTNLAALHRDPIITDIKDGGVDLIAFAHKTRMNSFYASYLEGIAPSDFVFVGFQDEYSKFCTVLGDRLGFRLDGELRLRESLREAVAPDTLTKLSNYLKPEIELYERFRTQWA